MRENALPVAGARKRVQGNFRLRVFRVPDISGKQDLPRLTVPGGRKSYRDPLRTGRRGRVPGSHRELLEKHKQPNRSGRLCERTGHKKQDERDRQACFSRSAHRAIHDRHHAATDERRKTLQDERQQGRVFLHGEERRPERHLRELPGCQQGRGAENNGDPEKQQTLPTRNPNRVPLHAPRNSPGIIKMLTNREKTLMLLTFCFAFCFALFVLVYPLTAFLIISLIVKHASL